MTALTTTKARNVPALSTFTFSPTDSMNMSLRAIMIDDCPWFIGMDVAAALGYSDAFEMTKRLEDDQKQNLQIAGFGNRGVGVINESGLYDAIFGSHKPEAKLFRRWVTADVLPTIRKRGAYVQGADKLSPEAQDALYASLRALLVEAIRRHDKATEHNHWGSLARQRKWAQESAAKIAMEMGLPTSVLIAATAYGIDAAVTELVKVRR